MFPVSPPEMDESLPTVSDGGGRVSSVATRVRGLQSLRDRLRFKRNHVLTPPATVGDGDGDGDITPQQISTSMDRPFLRNRLHQPISISSPASAKTSHAGVGHHSGHHRRNFILLPSFRGSRFLYILVLLSVSSFAAATVLLQSSIGGGLFSTTGWDHHIRHQIPYRSWLRPGTSLRFAPVWISRRVTKWRRNDDGRSSEGFAKVGLRPPKLAIILGRENKDPQSLMFLTVIKNLQNIGYSIKLFAPETVVAESMWMQLGQQITSLRPEKQSLADWSSFEGIIAYSLDAMKVVSSLMQEPFRSVPLIWIIQDDALPQRLSKYNEFGINNLVTRWRSAFGRADVVVFPDHTLPMLYSVLDYGNFFVIPGTPAEVWATRSYAKTRSKDKLRAVNGLSENDVLILVLGSMLYYDGLPWDYAISISALRPLLTRYAAKKRDAEGSFKFMFLCGNSSHDDSLQEMTTRYGLKPGSLLHHGMNYDVNSALMMSDIVLYGSSQDEQGFPPLIIRAMTLGLPVVAPDIPILRKYIIDGVHGLLFPKQERGGLLRCFSLLISDGKVSELAHDIASSGRRLVETVLAPEHLITFSKLMENLLSFSSDTIIPSSDGHEAEVWDWGWSQLETFELLDGSNSTMRTYSIVDELEENLTNANFSHITNKETESSVYDLISASDWKILQEIENTETFHHVELEEIEERMDKAPGIWDDIYRNARRSDKLNFEANERDEGELERTGQPVCIYEIYDGTGAWPFLHTGSLYRGLSLCAESRRTTSDDVNAVSRLPILNDTDYKNKLCEIGGMFSIANKIDNVHSRPWIGFQSWRATGRKVSLSRKAERVLEEKLQKDAHADVIYFWVRLDIDEVTDSGNELTFWSTCDILNGGKCRASFGETFRRMYSLPPHAETLPPMPEDGGHWSALHSWVMPTSSFVEFVMFSRMFVDSLDALHANQSLSTPCLLASSANQERHCYCGIMEVLINVWGYHSGRRMVYLDPESGYSEEQHPLERRNGVVWAKYFSPSLLKSMDEDLAEAADDGDHPRRRWLWPLTGEVHWQGIYEREREERYRLKMDKKRKVKEKLNERMKSGYKQKPLALL